MDKKLRKLLATIGAIVVAFFVGFTPYLREQLVDFFKLSDEWIQAIVMGLAYAGFHGIQIAVRWGFNSSTFIRRKFFGRNFIEGRWIDIAYDTKFRQIREVAIIRIYFNDDEIKLEAILFDLKANRIGSFDSKMSKFDGNAVAFAYRRTALHDIVEDGTGFASYDFPSERPYPLTFTGKFKDPELDTEVHLFGEKILDESDIVNIRSSDHNAMDSLVLKKISEFQKNRKDLFN